MVTLEKVERNSGPLIGSSIASIQKSTAPEVIFKTCEILHKWKLSYTNSSIEDAICVNVDATSTDG